MGLTNMERETIILYNEAEKIAEIYTHNGSLKKRIRHLTSLHPDLFKIINEDTNGGMVCTMPKKRMSVVLTSPPTAENSKANSLRAIENQPLAKYRAR